MQELGGDSFVFMGPRPAQWSTHRKILLKYPVPVLETDKPSGAQLFSSSLTFYLHMPLRRISKDPLQGKS